MTLRFSLATPVLLVAAVVLSAAGCGDEPTPDEPDTNHPAPPPIDPPPADTPVSFTDHVRGYSDDQVAFEMVLIPGDEEQNIKPFYVAETEVTWGMFEYWMYCGDLNDKGVPQNEIAKLEAKGLRPSPLYGEMAEIFFVPDKKRPAIAMSWRTAQAFCIWLSEQTGRKYRLPTDQEWMHVFRLSGGIPPTHEALADQAVLSDTGGYNEELGAPYFHEYLTRPVKSRHPGKLGLYDLLGNAAEWVEPIGEQRWVRGGHFELNADALTDNWRATEDQDVWNASYPQVPVSRFWYTDHYYQGIRLVCEVEPSED